MLNHQLNEEKDNKELKGHVSISVLTENKEEEYPTNTINHFPKKNVEFFIDASKIRVIYI